MNEEKIDKDEHWSYTIMGNWRALDYYEDIFYLCVSSRHDNEKEMIRERGYHIPSELMKDFINRSYEKLLEFVNCQDSRLAYLILGVFLMKHGGKMSKEVKNKILKFSHWKYESHQFKSELEKELRMKYLAEFREKINNYTSGEITKVTEEDLDDIYRNHGPFNLTPIDNKIE